MSEVTGIAVAANADGRLELVAASNLLSQPGGAWHAWQTTPNGAWTGWRSLGKPGNGLWWNNAPALARNDDGRLEVLVVSADGTVWHAWQVPGAGWSAWSSLGKLDGQAASGIAALAGNADGRLEAFLIGEDRAVWHRWQLPQGGHWSAWSRLGQPGGRPTDYLAVGANADGRLELFVLGHRTGPGLPDARRRRRGLRDAVLTNGGPRRPDPAAQPADRSPRPDGTGKPDRNQAWSTLGPRSIGTERETDPAALPFVRTPTKPGGGRHST